MRKTQLQKDMELRQLYKELADARLNYDNAKTEIEQNNLYDIVEKLEDKIAKLEN